ncbi:MAG: MBL fold metallo-hydrolase [Solirubrobacterales bacterium]
MQPGDQRQVGPYTVNAVSAVDGLGSPQISWIVEAGGTTVFHGGDTLWHGGWWDFAAEYGPIDAALLPGNAARLDYPMQQPAVNVPATLSPEQAVEAAYAMQTELLIPMHFSRKFEHEKFYRPIHDSQARLETAAAERDVTLAFPEIGDFIDLRVSAAA